jgi:hypothetical protein
MNQSDGKVANFLKKRSESFSEIDSTAKGYVWPAAAILLVLFFVTGGKIDFKFDAKTKPVAAVEFLMDENLQGNMFNNDEFGDYIIYAAWPKYKVFVDGRSDMYGTDIMKEYLKLISVLPGWNEILTKYNINWVIYNSNSSLSTLLMERVDWNLIYSDKVASIFVKNTPENQHLIEKYPDVELVIEEEDEK